MATLRLAAIDGATKVFLTSLGGTTGTPAVAGYALTQVVGLVHDATITGLTGPFYAVAKDGDGTELGYVYRVTMVDDSSVIDATTPQVNVISFDSSASTSISSTITGDVNVSAQTRVVVPVNAVPYNVVRDIDNQIIIRKYAGFSYTLQDVGDLAGVTKITFTVKGNRRLDLDAESLVQVVLTIPADAADGIKYLNKAAAASGDVGEGSIAVQTYTENDISKKRIVVSISDKATAKIPVLDTAVFDIKQFVSGDSDILDEGTVKIIEATTWTVSS